MLDVSYNQNFPELAPGKMINLFDICYSRTSPDNFIKSQISNALQIKLFKAILNTLVDLYANKLIFHRDLQTKNVVISFIGNEVKATFIGDEYSCAIPHASGICCGTFGYQDLEDDDLYTFSHECFSICMIFCEISSNKSYRNYLNMLLSKGKVESVPSIKEFAPVFFQEFLTDTSVKMLERSSSISLNQEIKKIIKFLFYSKSEGRNLSDIVELLNKLSNLEMQIQFNSISTIQTRFSSSNTFAIQQISFYPAPTYLPSSGISRNDNEQRSILSYPSVQTQKEKKEKRRHTQ